MYKSVNPFNSMDDDAIRCSGIPERKKNSLKHVYHITCLVITYFKQLFAVEIPSDFYEMG